METVTDFIFLGPKITVDSDCSHEIKRLLLLGRKTMTNFSSVQFSSVAQLYPTLCDSTDCCTPGFSVHHQLPELAKTYVHKVDDAIQPSHPLLSPFSPAFNLAQHQCFSNELVLCIRWPKYWSSSFNISLTNEHPGLMDFRMD